jgi:DNA-binding CsgD family transcriptional regulator
MTDAARGIRSTEAAPDGLGGLDALVAAAYEAGTGARPWEDVCDAMLAAFDLWGVQILGIFKANGSAVFSYERGGPPPEARLQYITTFHALNPRIDHAAGVPLGGWFHDHEHFDETFVATHPFFRDFLVPYGGRHMSATKLLDTDEVMVFVGLHRSIHMRPMSPAETARFDRVRAALSRALLLHLDVQRRQTARPADHVLLDALDLPVISVHATRLIGYRNPAADRLLRSGGALCEREGFLDAVTLADSRALAGALYALHVEPTASRESPPDRHVLRLDPVGGRPEQLVVLVPIGPEAAMHAFGDRPGALVIAQTLGHAQPLDPALIAMAFGLTPTESRVAAAIAAGQSPERIATERGVALATVRAQLRTIHEKTGASRQSDLVRRLLSLPRFADPGDAGDPRGT